MSGEQRASRRLAILIDADNISSRHLDNIVREATTLGTLTVRRIYGDWTTPNLAGWKSVVADHAIRPVQQFANTKGKNSSDGAMIIDAMDLLHSGKVDGFCLVSSDSDFTALATRIRNEGLAVYGFGEERTPRSLIAACDRFTFVEYLHAQTNETVAAPTTRLGNPAVLPEELTSLVVETIQQAADDTGWTTLAALGSLLTRRRPDFDSRQFGKRGLRALVESIPGVETEERATTGGHKHVWVRAMPSASEQSS